MSTAPAPNGTVTPATRTPAAIIGVPDISPTTGLPPPPKVEDTGIFYDDGRIYLVKVSEEKFIRMNASDLRRHLITLGFNPRPPRGHPLAELDRAIHQIQTERYVSYVGPLAGHRPGLHKVYGNRVLVTSGPTMMSPDASVQFGTIWEILQSMFGTETPVQFDYFVGWLAHAYNTLRAFEPSHGQALALAGPRCAGKSLLQDVVGAVLGGRMTSPHGWMSGKTDFNSEMFGCEVLSFGDEVSGRDYRSRQRFGDLLKQIVVNTGQTCHQKGREKVTLTPFWRLIFSLNDDPAALEVLPPLNSDGMTDKITLLKVSRPALFDRPEWAEKTESQRWKVIEAELPGFLAHLAAHSIPADLKDPRLGIRAYQHPALLAEVNAETPARRLLSLIDAEGTIFTAGRTRIDPSVPGENCAEKRPWTGTAMELERKLTHESVDSVKHSARKLLDNWAGACGHYLTELAKSVPNRVRKLGLIGGANHYEVQPAST